MTIDARLGAWSSGAGATRLAKRVGVAALLPVVVALSGCAATNPALPAGPPPSVLPESALVSPEIHEDGSVTFRVHAPAAAEAGLVMDGRENVAMTRADDGTWSHTTPPLAPDIYAYHFAIDGQPARDRNNPEGAPLVTGDRHSFVHIAGAGLPWERRGAPRGTLRSHEYESERFGETRDVWVYTPPGYGEDSGRSYPVLVLLHGVMSDARSWSTIGRADVIVDNLIAAGQAQPMIVVMPLGYGIPDPRNRVAEMLAPATNQRAVMSEFAAGLLDEVLPLVDGQYRTSPDAGCRAIAGFSMGGSQALAIGLAHPDVFGFVASVGGAFIMFGLNYDPWFPRLSDPRPTQRIAISVGEGDFLRPINQHMVNWLAERAVEVDFQVVPGDHSMQVGRRELIRLGPMLFGGSSSDSCGG